MTTPDARRWVIHIDDDAYVFPEGTTREHAASVLEEAKRVYLRELLLGQLRERARLTAILGGS